MSNFKKENSKSSQRELKPLNTDKENVEILKNVEKCGIEEHDEGDGCSKDKSKREMCKDFEQILDLIGAEGKYQKTFLYGVLCPIVAISPFMFLNMIFMWDIPDHWCHVPGRDPSMTIEEWKNFTLPWKTGPDGRLRHSQCQMYAGNLSGDVISCQMGWEYDTTEYSSTVPSAYDWVCDKDHYTTECFTWGTIGTAIGSILFGILGDKFGRKPIFFFATLTNVLLKIVSLFLVHDYFIYKNIQLLLGLAYSAIFTLPALMLSEISGTEFRPWIYTMTWMIWVVGNAIMPLIAMLCRDWFLFGLVTSVPGLLLLFYYPFVDDSPRWLVSAGKTKPALKILLKIAQTNGKSVDSSELEEMVKELANKQEKERKSESVGVWSLFSNPWLAKNTVILTICWTMNALLYDVLILNTTRMAGNQFMNYFLLALIELPGGWVAGQLVEVTGRRWTQAGFFLMCALACLIAGIAAPYPNYTTVVILAALAIKFGVSITELVVCLQGTEIFPTQLRSTGSGLASTMASSIGIFGPYIAYSGTVHVSLPYLLLCSCSFLGMIAATFLPETFKQNLPETIKDANDFGRGQKFWSYLPQEQKKKTPEVELQKAVFIK